MKATKRAKSAGSKSKGIKKAKSLESVKPLTKLMDAPSQPAESVTLNFTKIQYDYKP